MWVNQCRCLGRSVASSRPVLFMMPLARNPGFGMLQHLPMYLCESSPMLFMPMATVDTYSTCLISACVGILLAPPAVVDRR